MQRYNFTSNIARAREGAWGGRMKSPFEELRMDCALVCKFFAVFARFEYAMKATRYCGSDRHGNAVPNWRCLKAALGEPVSRMQDEAVRSAIAYLLATPPEIQKVINEHPQFQPMPLCGENLGAKAIEATKRVRNNLFHGGKHTPHSPPEHDTRLVQAAIAVLQSCLDADPELNSEFEHQLV